MFKFRGLILFLSTILFFLCFGNGFSYSFPTITSISPENEVNIGSLEITVNGSDFQSGAQVKLTKGDDQITATSVLLVSSNEIKATFNLSGMSGGYWNVFVSNPDGQSVIFSESFGIIESALNFSTQLFWPSVDVTEIWGEEFIYVAPQWSEPVNKYNSEGVLVSSFKPVWPGADISISKSNKIYLASGHSSAILIHDLDGNQLKIHLLSQWAPGVVADSVDNMYVVGSYGVFQKFNSSGQLEWQINGSFPGGSFSRFRDIALNESEELLYIADYYNGILVFNNNGEYIKKFGEIGANYSEVCTEPSNDFILAYAYNLNQVHIFDQHGNLIMEFGRPEYFSGIITGFSCDGDGNVYTAFHEGLVQKFKLPPLRDTTPPSRVMDLHVIDKSSTSVTLGWTAT
ncbi:MAG: IPT/TIG domain-containing protein, partial [Elusimicrobiales bacterium]|nr:IPT/TIG domain-containing protein [Elusimicrobiales bacterium]